MLRMAQNPRIPILFALFWPPERKLRAFQHSSSMNSHGAVTVPRFFFYFFPFFLVFFACRTCGSLCSHAFLCQKWPHFFSWHVSFRISCPLLPAIYIHSFSIFQVGNTAATWLVMIQYIHTRTQQKQVCTCDAPCFLGLLSPLQASFILILFVL